MVVINWKTDIKKPPEIQEAFYIMDDDAQLPHRGDIRGASDDV